MKAKKIIGLLLFLTFFLSIVFSIHQILSLPDGHAENMDRYVLSLIKCLLGMVIMFLPNFLKKQFSMDISDTIITAYYIFLYCGIYLGDVHRFFARIPYWDSLLHAFSSGILSAFGFTLAKYFNKAHDHSTALNPFFIALFAFCFSLAVGVLWEIYEYTGDYLFSLNMQNTLAKGKPLLGREALRDTMEDMIINTVGALTASAIGYFSLKKNKNRN